MNEFNLDLETPIGFAIFVADALETGLIQVTSIGTSVGEVKREKDSVFFDVKVPAMPNKQGHTHFRVRVTPLELPDVPPALVDEGK